MLYTKEDNRITIRDLSQFDTKHIVDCGQLFRYETRDGNVEIIAENKKCVLKTQKDCVIIESDDADYFENYFDLATDYNAVKALLEPFGIDKAIEYGNGIRLLRQSPFETIISFIVSANNNIPRIKGILNRMADALGEDMGDYRAFPTPEALARQNAAFYKSLGAGYRAEYIVDTARRVADGYDVDLYDVPTDEARKRLLSLMGVGDKVADCILLFAYRKEDVFPVDTWVKKIYADLIDEREKNPKTMAKILRNKFGNLAGYAQQYLFYYYRNNFVKEKSED